MQAVCVNSVQTPKMENACPVNKHIFFLEEVEHYSVVILVLILSIFSDCDNMDEYVCMQSSFTYQSIDFYSFIPIKSDACLATIIMSHSKQESESLVLGFHDERISHFFTLWVTHASFMCTT